MTLQSSCLFLITPEDANAINIIMSYLIFLPFHCNTCCLYKNLHLQHERSQTNKTPVWRMNKRFILHRPTVFVFTCRKIISMGKRAVGRRKQSLFRHAKLASVSRGCARRLSFHQCICPNQVSKEFNAFRSFGNNISM